MHDGAMHDGAFHHAGDYKEVLLKYISPDQLPEAYGGTRCEPDPYCTKYVSHATLALTEEATAPLVDHRLLF